MQSLNISNLTDNGLEVFANKILEMKCVNFPYN